MKKLTILTAIAVLALAGCGSNAGTADYEPKQGGGSESGGAPTTPTPEHPPEHPTYVVGEAAEKSDYSLRVLSVVESEEWYYPETQTGFSVDAVSMAGNFVTTWVAVRNTGDYPLMLDLEGSLEASGQHFAASTDVQHPRSWATETPPNDLIVTALVFDVPEDATPEKLSVSVAGDTNSEHDLTQADLGAVPPDETLAYQYELVNTEEYGLAYDLFDAASQARFTEAQYAAGSEAAKRWPSSDYAFRDVEIGNDTASLTRVLTLYDTKNYETSQSVRTQEFTREEGVWKITARPEQVETFTRY